MMPENKLANLEIDISVQSPAWEDQFPEYQEYIVRCFEQIITHVPGAKNFGRLPHLELSILLTDDHNIQALNRDYRDRDKATNVLSFPSLSADEIEIYLTPETELPAFPVALGDIIFARGTITQEAEDQGKSFADHFCHLCIHGMLHLLGYDHIEDKQAEEMEALEKMLLSKLAIDDPY